MNIINQSMLKEARQKELRKLGTLLKEAKAIRNLKESKSQKEIKDVYLSEANKLMTRYASLLLLEFIEQKVAEAGKILHVIKNANNDNEIGRYLGSLEIMKKVSGKNRADKVDVFTRIAQLADMESKISAGPPVSPSQVSTRLSPSNLGPGVGSFRAFEEQALQEAIEEGLFDKLGSLFGRGKKEEPYVPQPSKVMVGGVKGTLGPALKTPKGRLEGYSKERETLTNLVIKDEPKLVEFAVSFIRFFNDETLNDPFKQKKLMKIGVFGSGIESLVKKYFGKVKGFNTKQFAMDIISNPDLIQTNLKLVEKYSGVLMNIDEVMQGILSGMKKGLAATAGEVLTGLGGAGSGGMSTMFRGPREE